MFKNISNIKKFFFGTFAITFFLIFLWSRTPIEAIENNNIKIFNSAKESVVYISTSNRVLDYSTLKRYEIPRGSGSGFIWDKQGHIVTNFHVIAQANKATVKLYDGKNYNAYVVGVYPSRDIAVLKIDAKESELKPIKLGSSKSLKVGQLVYAIGNPFGLDWTMTHGIISALHRDIPGSDGIVLSNAIQTDAAINPGNSGGVMLNSKGELIGVNSTIFSPVNGSVGVGFAIPVDFVKRVVKQLIKYGKYIKPSIGIEVDSMVDNYLQRVYGIEGVAVLGVLKGSDAYKKGLVPARVFMDGTVEFGDIILKVNGKRVRSIEELDTILDRYKAGDSVDLLILRNGKRKDIKVKLIGLDE